MNGATTVEASIDNHAPGAVRGRLVGTEHYKARVWGGRLFGQAVVEKDGGTTVFTETILFGKRFGGKDHDKVFGVNNF